MAHHNTVFAQMLKLIPRHDFGGTSVCRTESAICYFSGKSGSGRS